MRAKLLPAAFFACLMPLAIAMAAVPIPDAPLKIEGAAELDYEGVLDLIESRHDLVIVDNRPRADYDRGHIEGAVNILNTDLTAAVLSLYVADKHTPVLFYCRGLTCGRSASAVRAALDWGYTDVYYYALGMDDWRSQGMPAVRN